MGKNISDPLNLQTLKSDFEYLCTNYFYRENYLKIDRKPFVYLYDSAAFIGDVNSTIKELRDYMRLLGYDIFLLSDHIHPHVLPTSNKEWEERARQFDGITSWLGGYSENGDYIGGSYQEQIKILYNLWEE